MRGLSWLMVGLLVTRWACAADPMAAAGPSAVDPSNYQALQWRFIGPLRGGRVLAVTGIAGDNRHFYFGSVDGGVWETQDAGRTWQPIFDGQPVGSIGAIAVAPSRPTTIYVGTGEADMRSDIAQGNGVYKSADGGAHWTHIGLPDSRQISRILVDPHNPDIVYVGVLGHPYGPSADRGVFRSRDGGQHWTKVLYENPNTGVSDLAFKPDDPKTIYAALWQTRRPPWNVYPPSNGPGGGLYVSHDGGDHWTRVAGHGFIASPGRIGLAVSPERPDRVYALADGPWGQAGLYRSDDSGGEWQHVSADPRISGRGWYFCALTADPINADRVFVMNTIVLQSQDGGGHFIALKGDPTGDDFHVLWIDPTDNERRILGSDQGAQITLNGGKTWSSWYNQPTAQIYHVSTDNRFPYWVYGSQQDSGAASVPSRAGSGDGITLEQFHEIAPGGENGMIAPDPQDPDIVYGDGTDSTTSVQKLTQTTGQVRNVDPTLAYPLDHYRSTWTLPLVFSKRDAKTLYFSNQRLFSTEDGGEHWKPISPDLTRRDPGTPASLDPATARDDFHVDKRRGVIYTIAPSPLDTKVIWVGTDDGLVWRTADGGAHWHNVTPAGVTPWSKAAGIELSHFRPGVAYLTIDRHRLDDDTPYIYMTRDDGKSWNRVDVGISRGSFVNVVREDPLRPGLLYAGTEFGLYVSFDDAGHWQSLQQNLPITSVRDIDVHGDDLVIATHGRGFWIMDDMTALRQMSHVQSGAATLFAPAEAIRVRGASFTGTPMPKDEPRGSNPPNGAPIDYVLPGSVTGPVMLTILDGSNQVVRRYSSAEHVPRSGEAGVRSGVGAGNSRSGRRAGHAALRVGSALCGGCRVPLEAQAFLRRGSVGASRPLYGSTDRGRARLSSAARRKGGSARQGVASRVAARVRAGAQGGGHAAAGVGGARGSVEADRFPGWAAGQGRCDAPTGGRSARQGDQHLRQASARRSCPVPGRPAAAGRQSAGSLGGSRRAEVGRRRRRRRPQSGCVVVLCDAVPEVDRDARGVDSLREERPRQAQRATAGCWRASHLKLP